MQKAVWLSTKGGTIASRLLVAIQQLVHIKLETELIGS